MTQKNKDIRREIIKAGLYNYEVAEAMGVSETYFSRLLHSTLLPSKITSFPPVPAWPGRRRGSRDLLHLSGRPGHSPAGQGSSTLPP